MSEKMSDEKYDNGGQAFPSAPPLPFDTGLRQGDPGMSLRDWFAGQALAGIAGALTELASREGGGRKGALLLAGIVGGGAMAYALADATLAARKAEPSQS